MGSIEIDDGTAVVIYDRRSGRVIHVHEEIVLEGGRKSSQAELMQNALKLARSFAQKKIGDVSTLVIESKELPSDGPLRVDVRRKRLLGEEARRRKPRRAASRKKAKKSGRRNLRK